MVHGVDLHLVPMRKKSANNVSVEIDFGPDNE